MGQDVNYSLELLSISEFELSKVAESGYLLEIVDINDFELEKV